MNTKIVAALAVFCFIAVLFVPSADAEGEPAGDYVSQLDANGQKVYEDVTGRFVTELSGSPSGTLTFLVYLPDPVFFSTEEEAMAYGTDIVNSALAAIYYTDAEAIWLWDLPVSSPEVTVTCGSVEFTIPGSGSGPSHYMMPLSVSFTVTVPEEFSDAEDTSQNEIKQAVEELRKAADLQVTGNVADKVKAIAMSLRGIKAHEDEEGTVSNAYDALVTGESSSAGTAMAFTYLCERNQVTAATVRGTVVTDSEGATSTGYWNVVWDTESSRWYGSDSTVYDGSDETPLLAGMSSLVLLPSKDVKRGFGSTHITDLDLSAPNSLESVSIPAEGYDWPDDRTFFEKYGTHIMVTLIVAIIIGVIVYAMRNGDI